MIDPAHPATLLVPVGVAALVAWRLYSRIRRLVSRQRLSRVRPWLTVVFFPLLLGLLLLASRRYPDAVLGLACGVLAGCALGWWGLRLTKFEQTPLGLFYTPNAHLGIALSLLLVGRIAYRGLQLYFASGSVPADPSHFVRSPLTLLIFGTLAGYYVFYAMGLLQWRRSVGRTKPDMASNERGD